MTPPHYSQALQDWEQESENAELPILSALEFLYDACAEGRREFSFGSGVTLSTVHSAKGTEHDHVVVGDTWGTGRDRAANEEQRRTFYVGITRAKQSLSIVDITCVRPSLPAELDGPALVFQPEGIGEQMQPTSHLEYQTLGLSDMYLGYSSGFPPACDIHMHLSRLKPGDQLSMRPVDKERIGLFDHENVAVARLSRNAVAEWKDRLNQVREVRVLAMVRRTSDQEVDPLHREHYRVPEWEIPVVEVVFENAPE